MQAIQNVDDRRVESAVQRGLTLIEEFMGMSRNEIASRVDSLTTPDLIDLMLFATEATVRNLPEESEARDRAVVLHMAARYFIYEPSAFDDVDKITQRLPAFQTATAQYVDAIVNAPEDERAALALRFLGFSEDPVSQVMEAHDHGDPDGIRTALSGDPTGKSLRVSKYTVSMEDWAEYTAGFGRHHFVDPTLEEDFTPLPYGEEALLPPSLSIDDVKAWVLQYFIHTYAESLNIIRRRYGLLRRQQLLASVISITDCNIENSVPIDEMPGILATLVLQWDELCKSKLEGRDTMWLWGDKSPQ